VAPTDVAAAGPVAPRGADRVLALLVELAGHPEGAVLDDLARAVASPKSTVHRALACLTRSGLASRVDVGRYALGDEFLRLAFAHHEARPDHLRTEPVLRALAERFGETAHYAVLDGAEVVYRAKADPPAGAVRLTSTVGGRNPAHCTAVGKLLLAGLLPDDAAVARWARGRRLERRTPRTLVDVGALAADLARTRARGYALDDQENEDGVCCLAVPAPLPAPAGRGGAISVSALAYRTPLARLEAEAAAIARAAAAIGRPG
jgi:IclR family transcriptional regulator, acetate operon repressor